MAHGALQARFTFAPSIDTTTAADWVALDSGTSRILRPCRTWKMEEPSDHGAVAVNY